MHTELVQSSKVIGHIKENGTCEKMLNEGYLPIFDSGKHWVHPPTLDRRNKEKGLSIFMI
jgi:hypothetical protein